MITPIEDARRAREEQTTRRDKWRALWDRLLRDRDADDPTTKVPASPQAGDEADDDARGA